MITPGTEKKVKLARKGNGKVPWEILPLDFQLDLGAAVKMGQGMAPNAGCSVASGGFTPQTIVIAGDGAVGKTCLFNRYMNDDFTDGYEPTIFEDWKGETDLEEFGIEDCKIVLRDTAGQEAFDAINMARSASAARRIPT